MADEFEAATDEFVRWLESSEAELSPKIKLVDHRSKGENRCVVASEDIAEGEVLFSLPRTFLLNVKTSALVKDYPAVEETLLNGFGHWEGLVTCLYYEYHVLKEKSRWWPYLKVLPSASQLDNLMYWTDEQLSHLQPSLIVSRIGKDNARQMFERVKKYVTEGNIKEIQQMTWEEFVHIASVIMAYSFDCELPEEDNAEEDEEEEDEDEARYIKCMVALADMLNSDTHLVNANLTYDDDMLRMVAIKDIPKGEQVYNIYGPFSNAEILRRYGYVEMSGSKYDYGEIKLEGIVAAISNRTGAEVAVLEKVLEILSSDEEWVSELFEDEDVILPIYDCYVDGHVLPQCTFVLQLLVTLSQVLKKTTTQDELVVQVRKTAKKVLQLLEGGRVTQQAVEIWKIIIENRLKDYPARPPKVDTNVITDGNAGVDQRRKEMANCILNSEIESLEACKNSLENSYTVIEDEKLLRNVMKRKLDGPDAISAKTQKKRK
ncbi:HHL238Cp [Eremothecium sinecaudum]|uniref:Ribosomal lysine N-methyltransferase 4 n=1 Tax=Eremothecium sinecaudum TaxID=45286 RepID=A0A120K2T4_9SACH|nr:HHL238Cp [Eremothecium sinecaudum]AMD22532.1 HHL238Cp [Eremothecium sinecaudum]